jgi:dynactin complex subunit
MSIQEVSEIDRIRERLRLVQQQFEREMRDRGFDPAQVDNVPLTASLANLHNEREQLRAELAMLTDDEPEES